jgi:hypothetical protein
MVGETHSDSLCTLTSSLKLFWQLYVFVTVFWLSEMYSISKTETIKTFVNRVR